MSTEIVKETKKIDAGFEEVQLNVPSLKFELDTKREGNDEIYVGQDYYGLLAGKREFKEKLDEETGELRPQVAFAFSLTKPGKAYDREGKPVQRKAGEVVLLWPNKQLIDAIEAVANMKAEEAVTHPTHMLHLCIRPIKRSPFKAKNGETRRMWEYKVFSAEAVARKGSKIAVGCLPSVIETPALQAQN